MRKMFAGGRRLGMSTERADQIRIAIADMIRVPSHDVRQHDRDCRAVRGAVMRRQRIGARVRRTEHRLLDRHSRFVGAEQHRAARLEIARRGQHALEVRGQLLPRVARKQIRDRRAAERDVRLDGV